MKKESKRCRNCRYLNRTCMDKPCKNCSVSVWSKVKGDSFNWTSRFTVSYFVKWFFMLASVGGFVFSLFLMFAEKFDDDLYPYTLLGIGLMVVSLAVMFIIKEIEESPYV